MAVLMNTMNLRDYSPSLYKGIFITATDTGVGKTITSGLIIRALIQRGIKVGAMKPFETGCLKQNGELIPSDGLFLKRMAEMDDPIELIVPQRFELPLSPLAASKLENKSVLIDKVFQSYGYLTSKYDFVVVEGAGGILVPIYRDENANKAVFMSDIIKALNLPLIIISRATLGTINHTLLTVNYALNMGIKVLGVIINFNNPPGSDISEKTNPEILDELSPVPILGVLPYISNITKEQFDNTIMSHKEIFDKIIH